MKRYEKVAASLMVCGFALALYLAMRSDANTIAEGALWPWAFIAAALQLTAMGIVKKGAKKTRQSEGSVESTCWSGVGPPLPKV